jgi:hypothetical protein
VNAQHLRPLVAFMAVAIVGGIVFANLLRSDNVVDAIRNGLPDVIAGSPLLPEPLYVVEDGEHLSAVPAPEAEPPSDSGPSEAPVTRDEGEPTADVVATAPARAAGRHAGQSSTTSTKPAAPKPVKGNTQGGQVPKAGSQGHGSAPGAASGGSGGHQTKGHGKGSGQGQGTVQRKGHGSGHATAPGGARPRVLASSGPGNLTGSDKSGHGNGHAKSGHGKGHAKSGHGKGHAKSGHGKGHAKSGHGNH